MSGTKSPGVSGIRRAADIALAIKARARIAAGRKPRFTGAYATREAAEAHVPAPVRGGYDRDDVVQVSLDAMSRIAPWDYPVLYWLHRFQCDRPQLSLLDAGGHLGTKFTAFGKYLDLDRVTWQVWDVPAVLRAGRAGQVAGTVPTALHFRDSPFEAGPVDVFLASGLMQYLDRPLRTLLDGMAEPPRWIVLNKVAVRTGETVVTLEQIGAAKVPYQIRDEDAWETEMRNLPYRPLDNWDNSALRHRIDTHPWIGESRSKGYILERI